MNIAIVGSGIGGLTAAWDLVKAGHQVTIFEAAHHSGGLAAGFRDEGWEWSLEKYYHHWFTSDAAMFTLIEELGLSDRIVIRRPLTVMMHKGEFYPLDSPLKALLFPGLGWGINKALFGLTTLFLRLTKDWHSLEKTTVDAWMRKWAGDKVYELMWQPMMEGKFGEKYASQVNMAWMWARLHARTTRLATFEGGFQAFIDTFTERLKSIGVQFVYNTPVNTIARVASGISLDTPQGTHTFDQCLVTVSPHSFAAMVPSLPGDYLKGLLDLRHLGAVVMVVSLNRPLSEKGYYWFNLHKSEGFPFLALVEHTNFIPAEKYGGNHLVYCGDYLENSHEYFSLSQSELLERFLPAFARINPRFDRSWVKKSWLFRTPYAQPVPLLNHSQNIPGFQTTIEGLFFASMSQVYPWDRGTNYAVAQARHVTQLMLKNINNT